MPDKIFPRGRGALFFLVLIAHALLVPAISWLSVLLSGLIVLGLIMLWLAAAKKWQFEDAWTLLRRVPKWAKRVIGAGLMLFAGWIAIRAAWDGAVFLNRTALPEWSAWAGTIALLVLCWLIARRGAPALCLWAVPMAWLAGGIIVLSLVLSLPDWQFDPTLGVFSLGGMLPPLRMLLPSVVLLCLFTGYDEQLPQGGAVIIGAAGAAVLAGLTGLRAGAVLGAAGARTIEYAVYEAAGVFETGVLQRSEVIFGAAFSLCMLARIALACCVIRRGWQVLREV